MPVDPRILKAILKFSVDKQTLGEVEDGARSLEDSLDDVERKLTDVREAADALSMVGETLAIAGAAMVAPFALAAQSYVQYAGRADVVSRRWLNQQRRLEQAQLRVGRVAAQAILPVMEKVADLAEDAADFAEKHPDAIKAILGIGGTLAAVGAAAATIGRAVTMIATVKGGFVALARLAGGAAGAGAAGAGGAGAAGAGAAGVAGAGAAGAGGLAAGGIALAGAGGLLAGGAVYQAITKTEIGRQMGLANLQQFAAVAAAGLGKLVGGTETANRWFVKVSGSLGAMDQATQSATESALGLSTAGAAGAAPRGRMISQAAVDTFIAYRKAADQAEEGYQEQRAATIEQFGESQARAETQFRRSEARALQQYGRQRVSILKRAGDEDRKAEEDYYRERRAVATQFGIETVRMEEDHQRNIERMRQTFDVRQEDAIAQRNFDAFIQNERQYENDRQQSEEDFQTRASRRNEDYGRQVSEMEQSFARQKEQRQAQLAESMAEAQTTFEEQTALRVEQHAESMTMAEEAHRDQLDTAARAHQKQLSELDSALGEQLAALDQNLLGEETLRNEHYARMTADLEEWLDTNEQAMRTQLFGGGSAQRPTATGGRPIGTWTGAGVIGGRQAGGYTQGGLYNLHGGEFVMNPQTTRMAERMAGGPLTQQNVLSGGARSSLDINVSGAYNEALVPTISQAVGDYLGEVILHLNQAQVVAGAGA